MFFKKKGPEKSDFVSEKTEQEESPLTKLQKQISDANLPKHALDAATKELAKLSTTDSAVAEYSVGLNYIELLCSLPWNVSTKGTLDMTRVQSILDGRHCGLAQVKQRILEFLAAKTLRGRVKQNILIVDDENIARTNMAHVLNKDGFACQTAENGLAALKILAEGDIDLIISDLKMDHMDGLELLNEVNHNFPDIPVIMVTGFATINSAVQAMKNGAATIWANRSTLMNCEKPFGRFWPRKLTSEIGKGPILCFTGPPGNR